MISREEFWRLCRFGLVGGGATLIDLGSSALQLWLWPGLAENLVSTAAFFVAFWFSFFGHRYITFQKQGAASKFLLVALFSLAVRNLLLLGLLWAGLSGLVPIVIATLAVTLLTYLLSRIWVFV
ncbi:GtrA family protein [Pseudaeromonas paramecii]|uniref:GtrA family protein n=1 Tax=Pseudaeromonas paramecii TaxID=2138166 RepID=A0ABP8QCM3_9GAMM